MRFPDFSLSGRVAIITGGSRGIGRAIALAMANAGADIAISGRRQGPLDDTAAAISALGRRVLTFANDIKDVEASAAMVQQVAKKLGTVDILVNNAGAVILAPTDEVTEESWDAVFGTNLRGLFFCTREAGRIMKAKRSGKVINIASAMGLGGYPNRTGYGASKGGVIQLTRMLAIEWAPFGINVNCICPQLTRTDAAAGLVANPALLEDALRRTPLGRIGEPEDMAGAAVFLASPAAGFITGQILAVDGGRSAAI